MNNSGLTIIAHSFRQTDAGLAISALEAAGFQVFAPHFQISGMTPHFAIAYGGIPIMVPDVQAADAVDFLHAMQIDLPAADARSPTGFRRGWIYSVRELLFYFLGGSRPPAGLFLKSCTVRQTPPLHNEL